MTATTFSDLFQGVTDECIRVLNEAKDRMLADVIEANGWTLGEAKRRLVLHQSTHDQWFAVFDRERNCYLSPRMVWGIGDDNVFRVTADGWVGERARAGGG